MQVTASFCILLSACTSAPSPSGPSVARPPTPSGWQTYTDPNIGFAIDYPSGWHLTAFQGCGSIPGALVSNLVHPYPADSSPNSCTWPPPALRSLPAGGAVVMFQANLGGGLNLSQSLPPNTGTPIRMSDLEGGSSGGLFGSVTFHHKNVYSVEVWLGREASSETRDTIGSVVGSIRPWAPDRPSPRYGRCVGGWEREPLSVSPELGGYVNAVSAISASDVWAVGSYRPFVPKVAASPSDEGGRPYDASPLTAHWDGARWRIVPASEPSAANGIEQAGSFRDVAVISPTEVWAVGGSGNYGLTERWDGSRWTVVPSPPVNLVDVTLVAVAGSGPTDMWAVGAGGISGAIGAIVEHWDGHAWTLSPVPPQTGTRYTTADDVSAASPADAWVVGQAWNRALALHWDGSRWRSVATPQVRAPRLRSVVDLSPHDAWAVGTTYSDVNGNGPSHALVEHWDGDRWKVAPVPPLPPESSLTTISASGPTDIWAAGHNVGASGIDRQLVLHYDGVRWSRVTSPMMAPSSGLYEDLAPTGSATWLVGTQDAQTMYEQPMPFLVHTCS
jgi:hypothetical protein